MSLAILTVTVVAMAMWGTAGADTGPTAPGPGKPGDVKQPAYLEIQGAQGTLVAGSGGAFQLTLSGVEPEATLFTDKPQRPAGSAQVADVLTGWVKNGFATNPPNAALVVVSGAGAGTGATFKLSNPQLSGGTLTFTAQPTSVQGNPNVAGPVQQAAKTASSSPPQSFGRSTLFVDPLQDFMHYCFAAIHNVSHQTLVTAGVLLLSPQYFPKGVMSSGDTTLAGSAGPLVCNINYGFTGGGFNIGLVMANPIGADNTWRCGTAGKGRCVVKVTQDTATFKLDVSIQD